MCSFKKYERINQYLCALYNLLITGNFFNNSCLWECIMDAMHCTCLSDHPTTVKHAVLQLARMQQDIFILTSYGLFLLWRIKAFFLSLYKSSCL